MSAATQHRLEGLEPDNLLAFMALLGLLRALEAIERDVPPPKRIWRPRAYWDETQHPLRPVLTLAVPKTREEVAAAAARGVKPWGEALSKVVAAARVADQQDGAELRDIKKQLEITKSPTTLSTVQAQFRGQEEEALHSALAAHAKGRKGEIVVEQTPLMFPTAQMAFVGALFTLSSGPVSKEIESALFQKWLYEDEGETLRFSPAEARRWALQAGEPADEGAMSVRGANSLAATALQSYPLFQRRGGAAISGARLERGDVHFWWPIWTSAANRGATLSALEGILRLNPNDDNLALMMKLGIGTIFEARRFRLIPNQRYLNVDWAVARPIDYRSELKHA